MYRQEQDFLLTGNYSWMRDARIICYDEDEEMLDLAKKAFCKRRIGSCYRKEGKLCEAAVS